MQARGRRAQLRAPRDLDRLLARRVLGGREALRRRRARVRALL